MSSSQYRHIPKLPPDAARRCSHVPQQIGIAVQIADRQLALGSVLHFIESIGTLFDRDAVAIAYQFYQLSLLGFRHVSVFVHSLFVILFSLPSARAFR
jgi:hypothetical protein